MTDSINERNLIVTFPNEFFGPKLLLAYTYSYLYGKSTLIFTGSSENTSKENSNKILGEDYQLLYRVDGGAYLFYQIPVLKYIYNFKSKKNKLIFDLYLPRATRQFKKRRSKEIKKEFDHKYKKSWHCIVGENFGCFVTHESKTFIFFEIANLSIALFKTARPES